MAITEKRRITILGATGSIGESTLDLIAQAPERFTVAAITAYQNLDRFCDQVRKFKPEFAVIGDEALYAAAKERLQNEPTEIAAGASGLEEAGAYPSDLVVAGIVGAAGLKPTLNAVDAGRAVALANKECLVCAGDLLIARATRSGTVLLPTDSEHNAIFQALDGQDQKGVEKLILTASGGPFRDWSLMQMATASPAQAIAHPNWSMGAKISVDSATMMNKGLELIEAAYLFDMPESQIDVVVHPQSVIHSMVQYQDGSVLAQMGAPDMRIPLAHVLSYPERMKTSSERLDFAQLGSLSFEAPDPARFPALTLARAALQQGGAAPPMLNAANEVAVASYLSHGLQFGEIAAVVDEVLSKTVPGTVANLEDVIEIDHMARVSAQAIVTRLRAA